jgi:hypothetical protein
MDVKDDYPILVPTDCTVIRCCEASRLQGQLLARAYQRVFPEVRRPLGEVPKPACSQRSPTSCSFTAAHAAGA